MKTVDNSPKKNTLYRSFFFILTAAFFIAVWQTSIVVEEKCIDFDVVSVLRSDLNPNAPPAEPTESTEKDNLGINSLEVREREMFPNSKGTLIISPRSLNEVGLYSEAKVGDVLKICLKAKDKK